MDNMKKHIEHKDTLKMMNDALKRQVDLVKEECELRIKVSKSYCKKKIHLHTFSPMLDHDLDVYFRKRCPRGRRASVGSAAPWTSCRCCWRRSPGTTTR